ncbi:hypothetical protein BH10ACT7_BH10ACT7_06060 [soil metagenome]
MIQKHKAPSNIVVVAGTAGGVGTTTITSLLFSSLARHSRGAPQLLDHSGGDLGLRLPEGDDVTVVDPSWEIRDLGQHALDAGVELLADPEVLLVIVAPATLAGVTVAERALGDIKDRFGASGVRQSIVTLVGVFGRHSLRPATERLQNTYGRGLLVVFPQDTSLAAGGRVPLSRLSADTARAQSKLVTLVLDRMALRQKR